MNKQEVYQFLQEKNIWFEITEHKAVYNMEEVAEIEIPYPKADAKTLFIRDDKKKNYYLITVKGSKRVNLKEFRKQYQTRPVSFASEQELLEKLHEIEQHANRERIIHWGPRTLDLDIIFYDKLVYEDENLIIPHIDMQNRDFVLKPLAELCPNYRHPVFGKTVSQLLGELKER